MTLSSAQQTAVEAAVVRFAYFAEFNFRSATVRVTSLNNTLSWGGFTWAGLGSLGNIGQVAEKGDVAAYSLAFTLNIAQTEWLTLSLVDPYEYRGLAAKLYFCPLDEGFNLIDAPVRCWSGIMDTMTVSTSGDKGASTGKITLKCETSVHGILRPSTKRLTPVQHKLKYPNDTGLDYLVELVTNPDANIWYKR